MGRNKPNISLLEISGYKKKIKQKVFMVVYSECDERRDIVKLSRIPVPVYSYTSHTVLLPTYRESVLKRDLQLHGNGKVQS